MSVTPKCLIDATYVSLSETSLYTVKPSVRAILDKATATNVSGSGGTNNITTPSGLFNLGEHPSGNSGFPGYIDEYRIVVGHAITSNFTPPTAPYTI